MYIKKGYNIKSLNNLKSYKKGESRSIVNGSIGGINSGITRRKKAKLKEKVILIYELQKKISTFSCEELYDFLSEYEDDKKDIIKEIFLISSDCKL